MISEEMKIKRTRTWKSLLFNSSNLVDWNLETFIHTARFISTWKDTNEIHLKWFNNHFTISHGTPFDWNNRKHQELVSQNKS